MGLALSAGRIGQLVFLDTIIDPKGTIAQFVQYDYTVTVRRRTPFLTGVRQRDVSG